MGNLGDFFPKDEYLDQLLTPGTLVTLWCTQTRPPKNKHFVLLVNCDLPLLFIINSEIHPLLQDGDVKEQSQLLLGQSDYFFLEHDSHINCLDPYFYHINQRELYDQIKSDIPNRIKGKLTPLDATRVIDVVEGHKLISPIMQREIIGALQKEYSE